MIRRLGLFAAALLCAAVAVAAQEVRVVSGAHAGYDRLALDLGGRRPWRVVREATGYALLMPGGRPRFDLSRAFDRIARARIADLDVDPVTGALRLRVGCACHVVPFEYRTRYLILDIVDGPPPADSPFERTLDGARLPPLVAAGPWRRPPVRGGQPGEPPLRWVEGYDWLPVSPEAPPRSDPPAPAATLPRDALRVLLLAQLARGAASGAVDVVAPLPTIEDDALERLAQVAVSGGLGIVNAETSDRTAASVAVCAAEPDVAAWGDPRPAAIALGPRSAGLTGEFDRADPDGLAQAVRYRLYLGFGAEARQLTSAFAPEHPDAELWTFMSQLVDGDPASANPLAGQEACDTPAALWAFLALPPGETRTIATGSILRTFSALPPHLRKLLGPQLVDRFLARGNRAAVRAVHDAVVRGVTSDAAAKVMAAALRADDPIARDAILAPLRAAPGPEGAIALAAAVDAHVARGESVPDLIAQAIEARLVEAGGAARAADLGRAAALSAGSRGLFDRAFALAAEVPAAAPAVWRMLAERADDSGLLRHAVLETSARPDADDATRLKLGRRLIDLGFADAAQIWLRPQMPSPEAAILIAEAALRQRDARSALAALAGLSGDEAAALRRTAAAALASGLPLGGTDPRIPEAAEQAAARQNRNWSVVAAGDAQTWSAAAGSLLPPATTETATAAPAPAPGPLAAGRRLIEDSMSARARLEELLSATEMPPPGD